MAKYRQLHTDFWNDGFVLDLTPEEKFFYIYLMTNSNTAQCGIYELPKRIIETQTGYNRETVDKLLLRFEEYKKIYYCVETKEIIILNWIKYNQPNNLNAVKCVNKELRNIKNIEFVSIFYKQCLNEELNIDGIFKGIEIDNFENHENITDENLNKPLDSPLEGAYKEPISKEVISNKQKTINNKQGVRSKEEEAKNSDVDSKFIMEDVPDTSFSDHAHKSYDDVLIFFERNVYSPGENDRKKLFMWSSFISCDLIIMAIDEALKYNVKNINYIEKILKNWEKKGLKIAADVKKYKRIWDIKEKNRGNKKISGWDLNQQRKYDFKELERKLLGWDNSG